MTTVYLCKLSLFIFKKPCSAFHISFIQFLTFSTQSSVKATVRIFIDLSKDLSRSVIYMRISKFKTHASFFV